MHVDHAAFQKATGAQHHTLRRRLGAESMTELSVGILAWPRYVHEEETLSMRGVVLCGQCHWGPTQEPLDFTLHSKSSWFLQPAHPSIAHSMTTNPKVTNPKYFIAPRGPPYRAAGMPEGLLQASLRLQILGSTHSVPLPVPWARQKDSLGTSGLSGTIYHPKADTKASPE